MRLPRILVCLAALAAITTHIFAQRALGDPEDRVIRYNESDDLADPVALLQKKLANGQAKLDFEAQHGYLISLLQSLNVPISSQGLVFSKTSFQRQRISPQTPRALYFNETVYVGWVPGGDEIELSAIDPQKGPIFYTLDQRQSALRFTRRGECMGCHLGPKTLGVPGLMQRSVLTTPDGYPVSQVDGFITGHGSPLEDRWGGWYVTGTHQGNLHLGNSFVNRNHPETMDRTAGANIIDLRDRFDTSRYLSPDSDIVALMVLAHQLKMHNLITHANYETHYALDQASAKDWAKQRMVKVAEPLLEYMLFRDEAHLKGPIKGTSNFAAEFQRTGPRDSKGRSLRELDLNTRLFRYPCSFLIYSDAFDALPQPLKTYLWQRLSQILTGNDQSGTYATMSASDRRAVLEILLDTKPQFRAWMRANPTRPNLAVDNP